MSRPEFKRGSSRDSGAPRASLVVKDDDGNVLTAPTAAKQDSALQSIAKQIEAQNAAKVRPPLFTSRFPSLPCLLTCFVAYRLLYWICAWF